MAKEMQNSKNKESLLPTVVIQTKGKMPRIIIKDYPELLKRSKQIGKKYSNFNGNEKQLRAAKRPLRRVSNGLNKRRKDYNRPFRHAQKVFKAEIDALRAPLDSASKSLDKKMLVYKKHRIQGIKSHLKPVMHYICIHRQIPDVPIPSNALKVSLTKKKRDDFLIGTADKYKQNLILNNSRNFHGKAISPDGEILPHYISRTITFFGDEAELKKLQKFAKKNNIHLNIQK